mmetsp:Transcript_36568/g.80089  ORF Transcript_36568/g.80089 Transcript_36568/m.80089 type:complete len:178 (-) Transcript_36568:108-641(-)
MQNVTALGPLEPFKSNLLSALGVMHFSNEEIKETFDELIGNGGVIENDRVFELLKTAYGFEPMPEEMGLFVNTLRLHEEGGSLTWEQLRDGMDRIRETLEGVSKNATEHSSYADLHEDRVKHKRYSKDPMDRYKAPMTESQSVGWHEEEVFNEAFKKLSCEETRYVASMVKQHIDVF